MDVKALYTSIQTNKGIVAVKEKTRQLHRENRSNKSHKIREPN